MNKRQFLLVLLMAFLGGIIGGALSNQHFSSLAYSKNAVKDPGKDTIDAKMFRVIDDDGAVLCTLGLKNRVASLEFSNGGDYTSRINHDGFESIFKHKEAGLIKTKIWPFGLFYYYYPKWEIEAREKKGEFFQPWDTDESLIRIGGDNKDGPSIIIRDKKSGSYTPRDRTVLGRVVLTNKNEERIMRPASSLVLFGENGNVLFSAP